MKFDSFHILLIVVVVAAVILGWFHAINKKSTETTKQLQITLEITKINHGITNTPEAIVNQK